MSKIRLSKNAFCHICRESVEGHYVPNGGFLEDVVIEDPALFSASQISSESASDSQHDTFTNEKEELVDGESTHKEINVPTDDARDKVSEELAADLNGLEVSVHVSAEKLSVEKEQQVLSSEEIDSLLDKCLLQALHSTVKDKDLPMPGSTLW